ncbi:MAG: 5-(carboxyamino)imidazole ribonucleotide synthase [Chloroflexota bacterium]|nr:5-(carboxyamino)imidazole ribonucleotide synthase [Chloroflexota bacterium]
MSAPILPGATVGVLGSGQLGRMLALAARRMGYRIHTFSPERATPTGQVADREIAAAYDDLDAVRAFATDVDVVTLEFENIPATTVEAIAAIVPVRPSGAVLHTTQHRIREKTFLRNAGFPVTPFCPVTTRDDLRAGLAAFGSPAILKTADFGYDGKGQTKISAPEDADAAFAPFAGRAAILEAFVPFEREVSVVAARGFDGSFAHFGIVENTHTNHILDTTVAPAAVPPETARDAIAITRGIVDALGVVGVACVEFFLTQSGALLVNEIAPRPHNSGHFTIDACATSQFEQQLRAVCGLPLGATEQWRPAAMANLLGDLWQAGEPDWAAACAFPSVKLHLYGKATPRPGRKMGHLTALASSADDALRTVRAARDALTRRT